MGSTAPISVSVASASFENEFVTVIEDATGWNVNLDVGVSDFTFSGAWEATAWSSVLGDILDDAGLCWSVNSQTHTITVENC